MREIKFRGKRIDNGEWAYGYFYEECSNTLIIENRQKESMLNRNTPHNVIPESVGQYAGIYEDDDIYEGDVFSVEWSNLICTAVIEYCPYAFGFFPVMIFDDGAKTHIDWEDYLMLKTGNIHDKPELLGVKS